METLGRITREVGELLHVEDPKLYDLMEFSYLEPNGSLARSAIDMQYKWFVDKGLYTGKTTVDKVIDTSYVEYALQKLGRQ